jgi:hypothetical protein
MARCSRLPHQSSPQPSHLSPTKPPPTSRLPTQPSSHQPFPPQPLPDPSRSLHQPPSDAAIPGASRSLHQPPSDAAIPGASRSRTSHRPTQHLSQPRRPHASHLLLRRLPPAASHQPRPTSRVPPAASQRSRPPHPSRSPHQSSPTQPSPTSHPSGWPFSTGRLRKAANPAVLQPHRPPPGPTWISPRPATTVSAAAFLSAALAHAVSLPSRSTDPTRGQPSPNRRYPSRRSQPFSASLNHDPNPLSTSPPPPKPP